MEDFRLLDAEGNELQKIEMAVPTEFELDVSIEIGNGGAPNAFISSGDDNYNYQLYLSRTELTSHYKLGECLRIFLFNKWININVMVHKVQQDLYYLNHET